jgi:hypothetical protein
MAAQGTTNGQHQAQEHVNHLERTEEEKLLPQLGVPVQEEPPEPSAHALLSLWPLVILIFFEVSGGPFGTEVSVTHTPLLKPFLFPCCQLGKVVRGECSKQDAQDAHKGVCVCLCCVRVY